MNIKTADLTGKLLDWFVEECKRKKEIGQPVHLPFTVEWSLMHESGDFNYSTDWLEGGSIIEREVILFQAAENQQIMAYFRSTGTSGVTGLGETHLTSAMRLIVTSNLGDEVEISDELLKIMK